MKQDDLISHAYLGEQRKLHATGHYGVSGDIHAPAVEAIARLSGFKSVLDYGSGKGYLTAVCNIRIDEYDPAIPGIDRPPEGPFDLVVCVDVLEHVEPDKIENVLAHIVTLARFSFYACIALRPSTKTLSDGRNAHIAILPPDEWRRRIARAGFNEVFWQVRKGFMTGLLKRDRDA
jgi:hypothetical protein